MEGGIVVGGAGTVGPARFSQNRAVCALSDEVRVGPDAFDLPDREHADRVRPGRGLTENLMLLDPALRTRMLSLIVVLPIRR